MWYHASWVKISDEVLLMSTTISCLTSGVTTYVIWDSGPTFPPSWLLRDQLFPLRHASGNALNFGALCAHFWLLAGEQAEQAHRMICALASAFCCLQWYFWSEAALAASFPRSQMASASTLVPPQVPVAVRWAADSNGQAQPSCVSCSLHHRWLFSVYVSPQIVSDPSVFLPSSLARGTLSPFGSMGDGAGMRGGRWWWSWEEERARRHLSVWGGQRRKRWTHNLWVNRWILCWELAVLSLPFSSAL